MRDQSPHVLTLCSLIEVVCVGLRLNYVNQFKWVPDFFFFFGLVFAAKCTMTKNIGLMRLVGQELISDVLYPI